MNKSTVVESAIELISPLLDNQLKGGTQKPLVVGIEGPQGSGKTTAASKIKESLENTFPNANIIQFSMDDFYLTYEQQLEVSKQNNDNPLLQGRGLPGTHDLLLLSNIFNQLLANDESKLPISIPCYDKSAYNGKGDRSNIDKWTIVDKKVDLIIFEGWFNGYCSINNNKEVLVKWNLIKQIYLGRFDNVKDNHIIQINDNLKQYEIIWQLFDLFVCIKTDDINNVYKWRIQQEHELIKLKGMGMNDNEVEKFVDRYMPVYYLYYDKLSNIQSNIKTLELNIDIARNLINVNYLTLYKSSSD